jgi:hypothetical protein
MLDMNANIKYKRILLLPVLICMTLLHIGCKNNDDNPLKTRELYQAQSSKHILFPSSVGSKWIYDRYTIPFSNYDTNWEYKNFDSFGINLDTLKIKPSVYNREITDSLYITINDTTYPSVLLNNGLKVPYFIGSDGVYNMGINPDSSAKILRKGLFLPRNIPLNIPWNGQISYIQEGVFGVADVFDRRCLSYNELINTPAGNFECYVIRTRIREAEDYPGYSDSYDYYYPNIGLVANVHIFILPKAYWFMRYIFVLKNYHN